MTLDILPCAFVASRLFMTPTAIVSVQCIIEKISVTNGVASRVLYFIPQLLKSYHRMLTSKNQSWIRPA